MENAHETSSIPPSIDRVLKLFRSMGREEKMQALVQYSKKLEPLPERFKDLDRGSFTIPECMTRVDIIPEVRDGKIHFYADLNVRESPTIAAVLAIIFAAVNGQPPSTTLGIPQDFVRILMEHRPWSPRARSQRNGDETQALRARGWGGNRVAWNPGAA